MRGKGSASGSMNLRADRGIGGLKRRRRTRGEHPPAPMRASRARKPVKRPRAQDREHRVRRAGGRARRGISAFGQKSAYERRRAGSGAISSSRGSLIDQSSTSRRPSMYSERPYATPRTPAPNCGKPPPANAACSGSGRRSRTEACEHEFDKASHLRRHLSVGQIDELQGGAREVVFGE